MPDDDRPDQADDDRPEDAVITGSGGITLRPIGAKNGERVT